MIVTNHSQNHTWGYTPDCANTFVTKRFWFCDRVSSEFGLSDGEIALREDEGRFPCGCETHSYVVVSEAVLSPTKGEA